MVEANPYVKFKYEFLRKYKNEVIPRISSLESERQKKLIQALLISGAMITGSIVLWAIINATNANSNLYKISGVLFVLSFIVYGIFQHNFEQKIKQRVMPIVCKCFPDLTWRYNPIENYNSSGIYETSNLINGFDDITFDDCFNGSYDMVKFNVEECHATKETRGSKGEKRKQTIFKGAVVTIEMNKNFKGNTIVRPNSFFNNILAPSFKLHKTTLEDVEFEKKFDVFTDDDVEARYLLTTSFMERLKEMQVAFKANRVSASFYEKKLYIALHTNKDLFKLGSLVKHVCDEKQFFTMFDEILSIVMLIDHFKLNQKTGL